MLQKKQSPVPKTTRRVTRHQVRDHIVRMVLTHEYSPGQKLVQQELARQLGVSRSAVREAMSELSGLGLIETQDNRGGRVSPNCRRFLLDALELREALERIAARRCCDCITRADIRSLTAMAHEIHRLGSENQVRESALLDRAFHFRLIEIAGNLLQIHLSRSLWFSIKLTSSKKPNVDRILADHLAILDAIQSGDVAAAEAATVKHVSWARGLTEAALQAPNSQTYWLIEPVEESASKAFDVANI